MLVKKIILWFSKVIQTKRWKFHRLFVFAKIVTGGTINIKLNVVLRVIWYLLRNFKKHEKHTEPRVNRINRTKLREASHISEKHMLRNHSFITFAKLSENVCVSGGKKFSESFANGINE